jgi:hypothetical protein
MTSDGVPHQVRAAQKAKAEAMELMTSDDL